MSVDLTASPRYENHKGWLAEVFHTDESMAYMVETLSGQARDLDVWHVHFQKSELFICVSGICTIAYQRHAQAMIVQRNLLPLQSILIGRGWRHSLYVPADCDPAVVLVVTDCPTYIPDDEGRIPMEVPIWK